MEKYAIIKNKIVSNVIFTEDDALLEHLRLENDFVIPITNSDLNITTGWSYGVKEGFNPPPEKEKKPKNVISTFAFRSKFTMEEKEAIYNAAQTDIAIKVWLDDLAAAQNVDLFFQPTIDGINFLKSKGLLTEARAAMILEPEYV